MADVRLIAAAIAVVAGCGPADAQNAPSKIAPPAGWRAVPELATAMRDALGKSVQVDGVDAWGETAMGCYGVRLEMRATGGADGIANHVLAGLTTPAKGSTAPVVAVRDVVKPSANNGVLSLAFERTPYRGRLRARIGGGKLTAIACFANQREPIACETACTGLLGAMP
jgi:hypothetical protein